MAHTRRRSVQRDEEEAPRRGRQRSQSPNSIVLPAAVLMGLIVGAILLARTVATRQDAQAAEQPSEPEGPKPFASVPDEEPPSLSNRSSGGGTYPRAPQGLAASNPAWAEALTIGEAADELFAEAQKAKQADDHANFQLKGKAAKETYDKAFTMTAVWEEELLEQYGDRDPQVRDIMRIRTRWSDRMRVLHKTTAR